MPKLDREGLMQQDYDIAEQLIQKEGKPVDGKRLADSLEEDWEILGRGHHLPESVKAEVNKAVFDLIKMNRTLAEKILPAGALEKPMDFERLVMALDAQIAKKIEAGEPIDPEDLETIARGKKFITRNILKPKIITNVDTQVTSIIEKNDNKSLEDVIEKVIAYLRHNCLGKDVQGVAFYLINEENIHNKSDKLTKTTIGIPLTKIDRKDFEKGKEALKLFTGRSDKPRTITDPQNHRTYFEVKINGHQLGLLEVELKPGTEVSKVEKEYIQKALSLLGNKIDEGLHSKRMNVIIREAQRILAEHGTQDNFEQGIAKFMEKICDFSTAYEAEVIFDVFGDNNRWFANRFNDDHIVTPIEMDESMKIEATMPAKNRRVNELSALVMDIEDTTSVDTEGKHSIIGKVIFRTKKDAEDLTNEDHELLSMCSEILSAHILNWRNELKVRTEGVDPLIAKAIMNPDGIADVVKENLTVFYTDIAGYTYICEILEDALGEENAEDIKVIRAVLEKFLNLIQEAGQQYGGVWDKAGGDMGLMAWGAPIDNKGLDPLGNDEVHRRAEFFAANAMKTAILVRHSLNQVSAVFREKLLEIAYKKYSSEMELGAFNELDENEQTFLLKKLEDETGLSPKISTTSSVYTGQMGFTKIKLGSADDWTELGNRMNSAARVQGTSLKMEIRSPLETRDLVEPGIKMDAAIPFNAAGASETWSEFFKKIGLDPEKVKVNFLEYYEGYKNKDGTNVVFTVNISEDSTNAIAQNSKMTIAQLLQYEGEEFLIEERKPCEEGMIFKLRTITQDPDDSVTFHAKIPQKTIDETTTRYKSPQTLKRLEQYGVEGNKTLFVQDGKLKEFEWQSIEADLDQKLDQLSIKMKAAGEKMIVYTKKVPTGCYQLGKRTETADQHEIIQIAKDNYTFKVKVSKSKIHDRQEVTDENGKTKIYTGIGAIMSKHDILYDFQSYYATIRNQISKDEPVVFVHKRHFYIVDPKEAEAYLMPIITRTDSLGEKHNHHENHHSSNPPTISNPPASVFGDAMSLRGEKQVREPSTFWTKMAEEVRSYKTLNDTFLKQNWNSLMEDLKPKDGQKEEAEGEETSD